MTKDVKAGELLAVCTPLVYSCFDSSSPDSLQVKAMGLVIFLPLADHTFVCRRHCCQSSSTSGQPGKADALAAVTVATENACAASCKALAATGD